MEKMISQKLTILVIAKNEESQIGPCLDSVGDFAPVLLLDDHSTDKTVTIARQKKAKIFHYQEKKTNFSALRNFLKSKASTPWIFYLDADERLTPDLKKEIAELIKNPTPNLAAAAIPRQNYYLGQPVRFGGSSPDYVVRLFYKPRLIAWQGELHEQPKLNGNLLHFKAHLLHFTHRDLSSMMTKTISWTQKEAELLYFDHSRLTGRPHPPVVPWRIFKMMFAKAWERLVRQSAWRDGTVGWINSLFEVFNTFIIYARLWEMQQNPPSAKK